MFLFYLFRLVRHLPIGFNLWFVMTRTTAKDLFLLFYLPVFIIIDDDVKPADEAVNFMVPVFSVDCKMAKHKPWKALR